MSNSEIPYSTYAFLSPRSREIIDTNYKPDVEIHIPEPIKPPSPKDSLDKSINYLENLKTKGFVQEFNQKEMKDIYYLSQDAVLKSMSPKKKTNEEEAEEALQLDPGLNFWLKTDTLNNYLKELQKLPFIEPVYNVRCMAKLRANAIQIAQKLNVKTGDKRSQSSPARITTAEMKEFIINLQKAFKSMISNSISKGLIVFDKLPESYKKEYSAYKPVVEEPPAVKKPVVSAKEHNIDKQMIYRISEASNVLAPSYRIDPEYGLGPESRNKILSNLKVDVNKQFDPVFKNVNNIKSGRSIALPPLNNSLIPKSEQKAKSSRASSTLSHTVNSILPKSPLRNATSVLPPLSQIPREERNKIIETFWFDNDPLKSRKGQPMTAMSALSSIADGFSFEHEEPKFTKEELYYPFDPPKSPSPPPEPKEKPEEKPKTDEKRKKRKRKSHKSDDLDAKIKLSSFKPNSPSMLEFWSTAQFETEDNTMDPNSDSQYEYEEEEEKSDTSQRKSCLKTDSSIKPDGADNSVTFAPSDLHSMTNQRMVAMEYLKNYGSLNISEENSPGDEEFKRLKNIWDKLGFTTAQKLQLVSKYSQSVEDTRKLYDSLGFWETTFESVDNFRKAYRTLRDYLRYETYSKQTFSGSLKDLLTDFLKTVHILQVNAENLYKLYGDELIIKGSPYRFELDNKRQRIKDLLIEHDVTLPDNMSLF